MTETSDSDAVLGPLDWTRGAPVLLVSACLVCGRRWYLPHAWCPTCGSSSVERRIAEGGGRVAAVTVVHRRHAGDGPAGIALVDLVEGVRVMVRCPATMPVGAEVVLGFVVEEGAGGARLLPCCEQRA